jgi:hypothetical protein
VARKQHAKKEGKATCKEKPRGEEEGKPNHDRVRVFDKDCNGYKPVK